MKKYLKIFCLLLLFLCSATKIGAVDNVNKDFCKTGQKYLFSCSETEKQCTYKLNDQIIYVNMNKQGGAKVWYDPNELYITNWGNVDNNISLDSQKWYKENKKCPTYFVEYVYTSADAKFYLTNSEINLSNVQQANPNIVNVNNYPLIAETTNITILKEEPSAIPDVDSCAGFRSKETCKIGQTKNAGNFGCAWNEQYGFCSPTGLAYLSCGGTDAKDNKENNDKNEQVDKDSIAYDIPVMVPRLTSYAITALKTITPVILIIIGMFQLIKAISSQNEDEMKKARSALIKKLIAAAMIFFLVAIVQFIVKQVADDSEQSSTEACFDCFINNNCTNAMYYTDGYDNGKCYKVSCDSDKIEDCEIDCPVDNY